MKCELEKLKYQPKNYKNDDEYLTSIMFSYFHILNLLWGKDGKKYTKSFLMFLVNSVYGTYAELIVRSGQSIEEEGRLLTETANIFLSNQLSKDDYIYGIVSELVIVGKNSTDIFTKLSIMLALLNSLGYKWDDVVEANDTKI